MKMFVWADPYDISYGSSRYTAVAENVEEARALVRKAGWFSYTRFDNSEIGSKAFLKRVEEALSKEPTRICEIPCAEFDEWSE